MNFQLKRDQPLAIQIHNKMVAEILLGKFKKEEKLPSIRALAEFYQVDEKTIQRAYDMLIKKGFIVVKDRSGHYVPADLPIVEGSTFNTILKEVIHERYEKIPEIISKEKEVVHVSENVVFESESIYQDRFNNKFSNAVKRYSSFQYKHKLKEAGKLLRESIRGMLATNGTEYQQDQLCIMYGVNNVYHAIFKSLLNAGDSVVMYYPCNQTLPSILTYLNIEVVPLYGEYDQFSNQVADLCRSKKISMVIAETRCQFPTTRSFSPEQKLKLHALAQMNNFLVLEIDFDHEFYYSASPWQSLFHFNNTQVIHLSCISQCNEQFQSLKYLLGPSLLIQKVQTFWKLAGDQDRLMSLVQQEMIQDGSLIAESRKIKREMKIRKEWLENLIDRKLFPEISYQSPLAGTSLWLTVRDKNLQPSIVEALRQAELKVVDPALYTPEHQYPSGIRLCFSEIKEVQAQAGIEKISKILQLTQITL